LFFRRRRHNPLTSFNCRQTKTLDRRRSGRTKKKNRIDTSFVKPRTAYFFFNDRP
jgi:hypothetical protein